MVCIHLPQALHEQAVSAVELILCGVGLASEVGLDGALAHDDREVFVHHLLRGIGNELRATVCIHEEALGVHLIREAVEVILVLVGYSRKE